MMIGNKLFFLFVSVCSSISLFGQNWWESENDTMQDSKKVSDVHYHQPNLMPGEGKITLQIDPKVQKLIDFKSIPIPPNTEPMKDGFRVQLFFDQDKEKVNEARAKVLEIDQELEVYIEYKAPNYNLMLGNYRTRLEAEKMQAQLSTEFPEGIVIATKIYIPKPKEN